MREESTAVENAAGRPLRILLLTYYFPPEQTPGAFRAEALLQALLARGQGSSVFVDVLTAQPSRYPTWSERGKMLETGPFYRIRRLPLPFRGAAIWDRSGISWLSPGRHEAQSGTSTTTSCSPPRHGR